MDGTRRGGREFADDEALIVEDVGEEADQLGERKRNEGAGYTDAHRHESDDEDAGISGEVPAVCVGNGRHVFVNLVDIGRVLVLLAPAIPLFGTVDFVGGSFKPFFDRRIRVRHTDDDFFLVALAAHEARPMRSPICRAWWCAWIT